VLIVKVPTSLAESAFVSVALIVNVKAEPPFENLDAPKMLVMVAV